MKIWFKIGRVTVQEAMIAAHQIVYISVIKWLSIPHISREAHDQQLTLLLFMQQLASLFLSQVQQGVTVDTENNSLLYNWTNPLLVGNKQIT